MAIRHTDGAFSGKPIALGLAILLMGAGIYKWWPSDERAIRRQCDALADVLTVPSTETELARTTRLAELRNYFAPDVRIHIGSQDVVSRDMLFALAAQWTPPPGGLFVEFVDLTINVADDAAQVSLTAKVSSRDARTGEQIVDARGANVGMAKQNGDWVITSVDWRETLETPQRP